ncbi:MAG: hypothetical protein ACTSR0_05555 [Candidatus Asgardarchaeia archaeon]
MKAKKRSIEMYKVYTMLSDGGLFHFKIGVLSIGDVFPHEEVIEESLKKLIHSIRRSNVLLHPVIVDERSGVILDGMHRYYAFKRMGFDYIGVCLIDYKSSYVAVKNWYRSLSCHYDVDEISDLISKNFECIEVEVTNYDEFPRIVERADTIAVLLYKMGEREITILQLKSSSRLSLVKKYNLIKEVENLLRDRFGCKISYYSEYSAIRLLKEGKIRYVLATPKIEKDEVIKSALSGEVFAAKSTRHVIPVRPLFVNFPLELFRRGVLGDSLEEKNSITEAILKRKQVIQLRGKVNIDRFYEEEGLCIFL